MVYPRVSKAHCGYTSFHKYDITIPEKTPQTNFYKIQRGTPPLRPSPWDAVSHVVKVRCFQGGRLSHSLSSYLQGNKFGGIETGSMYVQYVQGI